MTVAPTYKELLTEVTALRVNDALHKTNEALYRTNEILYEEKIAQLESQLEWFRKQVFGPKSERLSSEAPQQLILFPDMTPVENADEEAGRQVGKSRENRRNIDHSPC